MKNLLAILAIAVLGTAISFADASVQTATANVTCTAYSISDGAGYTGGDVVAGQSTTAGDMSWTVTGNASNVDAVMGGTVAVTLGANPQGGATLNLGLVEGGVWNGNYCNATAVLTCEVYVSTSINAVSGPKSWEVTLTLVP